MSKAKKLKFPTISIITIEGEYCLVAGDSVIIKSKDIEDITNWLSNNYGHLL